MSEQQQKDFFRACGYRDLEKIKELAPLFDLNNIRNIYGLYKPTPLVSALNCRNITDAVELLLELGAIPSPLDAYIILHKISPFYHIHLCEDFFKGQGYDLRKLDEIYHHLNKRLRPRRD